MGRIVLDADEERELAGGANATTAKWLPGARGPGSTSYHNPRTGQEFRLPFDAYSIARYSMRGLVLGRAPDYLKQLYQSTPREIIGGVVEGPYDLLPNQTPATPQMAAPAASVAPTSDPVTLAILEALTALTQEVKNLKQQVDGTATPARVAARQLSLFDE
jgi:hypothetical protein